MGRFKAYEGLINYYLDANRMCRSFLKGLGCEKCPLHIIMDEERTGCDKDVFSFNIGEKDEKRGVKDALYKMYAVAKWCEEHPETEAENDVI